jgi:SAM-dependent methyltransferase
MRLDIERMSGYGCYLIDEYQVNYLFGLDDICKKFINDDSLVLELGSNDGVSTSLFSKYAKNVTAVDILITNKMSLLLNDVDNIDFYNMNFNDFYDKYKNRKYDLIYIDGSHEYVDVREDIIKFKKLIKENGVICGHDYNSACPGVIRAVNEIFGEDNIKIYSDSSWVVEKILTTCTVQII